MAPSLPAWAWRNPCSASSHRGTRGPSTSRGGTPHRQGLVVPTFQTARHGRWQSGPSEGSMRSGWAKVSGRAQGSTDQRVQLLLSRQTELGSGPLAPGVGGGLSVMATPVPAPAGRPRVKRGPHGHEQGGAEALRPHVAQPSGVPGAVHRVPKLPTPRLAVLAPAHTWRKHGNPGVPV